MTIETKYNIGDTVWIMQDNKVVEKKIYNVIISGNHGGSVLINYYLTNKDQTVKESEVYPSKEALIASL